MLSFQFLEFDCLSGGDIDLIIDEKVPADEAKSWVPAYNFNINDKNVFMNEF